jgi:hypothetical protein
MTRRPARTWSSLVLAGLAACGDDAKAGRPEPARVDLSPAERDAEALGQAVLEMVDRAVDYRGSHRGRPAASLRQMGVDSLTPTMVLRVVNVNREPVVTVGFRRPEEHEIVSCHGDSAILEEAVVSGGRFTIMCATGSGQQRPMQVGGSAPR